MGSAAQILKGTFAVQAHIFLGGNAGNDFRLVVLPQRFEVGNGLVAWQNAANNGFIQIGQGCHFLFDRDQVIRSEWPVVRKIVIEAVFDHRPNGDLRFGKKVFDCVSQQVGRRMPNDLHAIGIFGRDDGQTRVTLNQMAGVDQLTIHFSGQGRLGQSCANGGCHIGHRQGRIKIARGAIGQGNLGHGQLGEDLSKKQNKRGRRPRYAVDFPIKKARERAFSFSPHSAGRIKWVQ